MSWRELRTRCEQNEQLSKMLETERERVGQLKKERPYLVQAIKDTEKALQEKGNVREEMERAIQKQNEDIEALKYALVDVVTQVDVDKARAELDVARNNKQRIQDEVVALQEMLPLSRQAQVGLPCTERVLETEIRGFLESAEETEKEKIGQEAELRNLQRILQNIDQESTKLETKRIMLEKESVSIIEMFQLVNCDLVTERGVLERLQSELGELIEQVQTLTELNDTENWAQAIADDRDRGQNVQKELDQLKEKAATQRVSLEREKKRFTEELMENKRLFEELSALRQIKDDLYNTLVLFEDEELVNHYLIKELEPGYVRKELDVLKGFIDRNWRGDI